MEKRREGVGRQKGLREKKHRWVDSGGRDPNEGRTGAGGPERGESEPRESRVESRRERRKSGRSLGDEGIKGK